MTFHDGSAMTSEDVARLPEALDGGCLPRQADRRHIEKIEALDPSTVRITLKEPYAPLLALLVVQQRRGGHHAGGEDGEPA